MFIERNPNFRKTELYPCAGEPGDEAKGFLKDCGKPLPFIDRIEITAEKEKRAASYEVPSGLLRLSAD